MSQKLYGFKNILELCCSSIEQLGLIVAANALWFFTGSGKVILFSLDPSDFCRSFRVESNTTIKNHISHDVLLTNEVHSVIERNCLFERLTTISTKIRYTSRKVHKFYPESLKSFRRKSEKSPSKNRRILPKVGIFSIRNPGSFRRNLKKFVVKSPKKLCQKSTFFSETYL